MPEIQGTSVSNVAEIKLTEKGYFIYAYEYVIAHARLRQYWRIERILCRPDSMVNQTAGKVAFYLCRKVMKIHISNLLKIIFWIAHASLRQYWRIEPLPKTAGNCRKIHIGTKLCELQRACHKLGQ